MAIYRKRGENNPMSVEKAGDHPEATSHAPWSRCEPPRWAAVVGILGLVVGGLLWASLALVAYTDWAFICENTGSHRGHREWFFGMKTKEWSRESELERFIKSTHPNDFTNRWTSYGGTGRSLLPGLVSRGHGRPGPLLFVEPAKMDRYVNSLSAKEKWELYQILSGTDEERIKNRVDEILAEVYAE